MKPGTNNKYSATIPGSYTNSPYPVVYYFEVSESAGRAALYPGLGDDLTRQPYFVIRQV